LRLRIQVYRAKLSSVNSKPCIECMYLSVYRAFLSEVRASLSVYRASLSVHGALLKLYIWLYCRASLNHVHSKKPYIGTFKALFRHFGPYVWLYCRASLNGDGNL